MSDGEPPRRAHFDPEELGTRRFYALLSGLVVPRPIAWVSTRSAEGADNLAPHSFFTVSSLSPPIVQFTSIGRKDTLRNVEQTRELVVNVAPAALIGEINETGADYPHGVSEFDKAGLVREASARVAPPRVAAAPAALECVLYRTIPLGGATVVMGRVVHAVVAASAMEDGRPAIERIKPAARLGGDEWSEIGAVHTLPRRRYRPSQ